MKQNTADLAVNKWEGKILPWTGEKDHSFCRLSANNTTSQLRLSDTLGITHRQARIMEAIFNIFTRQARGMTLF